MRGGRVGPWDEAVARRRHLHKVVLPAGLPSVLQWDAGSVYFGPRLAACVRNPGLLSTGLGLLSPGAFRADGLLAWECLKCVHRIPGVNVWGHVLTREINPAWPWRGG